MKKKSFLLWSLCVGMSLTACSDKNELSGMEEGEKANLSIKLDLGTPGTRAAGSTAIPATSWAKIQQVQLFLYDKATKVVRFSDIINPTDAQTTFTYSDVPVGTYDLVLVANAKNNNALMTYLDGGTVAAEWTKWNVRQKLASNMLMKHKPATFPSFYTAAMAGKSPYAESAEVFMGEAQNVQVAANTTTNVPAITIKREVSLMRVRLDVSKGDGTNNTASDKGVDFTTDASIMIHRLPNDMKILAGTEGGVNAASTATDILSIHGSEVFKTADPTSGYNPTQILKDNFTMWRDVVVFPNYGGRAAGTAPTTDAAPHRRYFIVVSGQGKVGHVLADGTVLDAAKTVYWSGVVKENFVPNVIREVNLTLQTGGTTTPPVTPTENGGLQIIVSAPAPWDSNIVDSNIIL